MDRNVIRLIIILYTRFFFFFFSAATELVPALKYGNDTLIGDPLVAGKWGFFELTVCLFFSSYVQLVCENFQC